jgi:hypothetical protein
VISVAGQRFSDGDDQASVSVDDDLGVGGVPIVFRLFGDRVVAGGNQGSVHDEDGVLAEPFTGSKSEQRPEVGDDPVRGGLRDAERWRELLHAQGSLTP